MRRVRCGMSGTLRSWSGSTCLFSTGGYVGTRSPDHADAAIWGLSELMLDHEAVSASALTKTNPVVLG